jgi:hypothetical protein
MLLFLGHPNQAVRTQRAMQHLSGILQYRYFFTSAEIGMFVGIRIGPARVCRSLLSRSTHSKSVTHPTQKLVRAFVASHVKLLTVHELIYGCHGIALRLSGRRTHHRGRQEPEHADEQEDPSPGRME